MIKLFFIINNLQKLRFCRFYDSSPKDRQQQLILQLFQIAKNMDNKSPNFMDDEDGIYSKEKDHKIIIRHFATLYFIMVIDDDESELAIIDLIQILVEGFDLMFENACELDLVYNPEKLSSFMDEIIVGGEVLDTNLNDIIDNIKKADQHVLQQK